MSKRLFKLKNIQIVVDKSHTVGYKSEISNNIIKRSSTNIEWQSE